jgi:hypothetical protein
MSYPSTRNDFPVRFDPHIGQGRGVIPDGGDDELFTGALSYGLA